MSLARMLNELKLGNGFKQKNRNGLKALDIGDTVPTDGTAGYESGAMFLHTNGSVSGQIYFNEGSGSSCNFDTKESGRVIITDVQPDETGWDGAAIMQHGTYTTALAYGTQTDHLVMKSMHITAGATGKYVFGDIMVIDTSATSTGYFVGGYDYITVNHTVGAAMARYVEVDVTATAALNGNVSGLYSEMCVTAGVITGAGKINGILVEMNVTAGVTIAQELHGIEVDMRDIKADIAGRTVGIKVTEAGGSNYLDYGMEFSNCFHTATAVMHYDLTQGNTACVEKVDAGAYTIANFLTFTNSGAGSITSFADFSGYGSGEGEIIEADGTLATGNYGKLKIICCNEAAGYINVYTTPN